MSKTVRIRTTPNGDDAYLKVKVEQDFDFIEILSLKISQAEAYSRFCSDYGVVVGRVIVNNGFGVPNAKVSIFVPLTDEDEEDSEIKGLYPFKELDDKDSEGIRYNLLQNDANPQETCFTPVGTFPAKREVIDNDTVLEVYDKYYKFTTTTNDAGDFMLFGVPTGNHTLNCDVDLSDIGIASQRPYDYITDGESEKRFDSPTKFKSDKDLDKLIQIKSYKKGVNVQPFWGDKDQCDIGITRLDIDIKKKITPSAIFMGSLFADSEKNSVNKNCRPRKDFGRICDTDTGEGSVEMIRKTLDGKIERFDIEGGRVVNEFGSWAYQVPMNLDVKITDEFGNLVPSEDPNKGLATKARVRFRVSKDVSGDEGRLRTTAKYLIPHNPSDASKIDYNFDENTSDEHFRDFHWNKIYSVSNFIPRIQATCFPKGKCADNRNITGIKDVDNCVGSKNPFPFNRVDTDFNPLFLILCLIMSLITLIIWLINGTVIAFVNLIIKIINVILEAICDVVYGFAGTVCGLIGKITFGGFNSDKCKKAGCISKNWSKSEGCNCKTILDYVPCITLPCGDPAQTFAPGCSCEGVTNQNSPTGGGGNDPSVPELSLGCWKARTDSGNGKNIQHWSGLIFTGSNCGHPGHNTIGAGVTDCFAIQLAEALNMFEFDFYNDWVNGTLYTYLLKYKKAKRDKTKFCDAECGSPDSDNGCDYSYFIDTLIDGTSGRSGVKKTSMQPIDEGFIKKVTKRLSDGREEDTLYYAPYASKVAQKLFATELVHLGSIFDCDWQGIPKIQQFLVPTTYNRAPYIDEWLIDIDGENTTDKTACGMTSTGGNGKSGVFFDIDCIGLTVGQIKGSPRADNFKRQCEFGMNIDEGQFDSNNLLQLESDCYLNDRDLAQPYAGRVRDIFYQLNINNGPTKLNSWPSTGLPAGINTGFGEQSQVGALGQSGPASSNPAIGTEYKAFRGTSNGQAYGTPNDGKDAAYVQPNNSFYFYFGTMPGQTGLELMNRKFFTTCEVPEVNDFAINLVSITNATNVCDGAINITVIGGEPAYIYNWTGPNGYTNPSTSIGDLTGLCAGIYTLTVTDANGGTSTVSYTISEPSPFNCSVTGIDSINIGGDGQLSIVGIGGVSPYKYSINGGTSTTMVNGQVNLPKPAGVYVVTVTDDNGNGDTCTNPSTGVTISEPPLLSIIGLTTFDGTTCGDDNGTITLALNSSIGGTPPYTIAITSNTNPNAGGSIPFTSSQTNLINLAPGTYDVSVTDSGFIIDSSGNTVSMPQVSSETALIVPSNEPVIIYNNSWYCWEFGNVQSQNIYPSFTTMSDVGFKIIATPRNNFNQPDPSNAVTELFTIGTTTATFTTLLKDTSYDFDLVDDLGCSAYVFADFTPNNGQVPSIPMRLQYIPENYCWVDGSNPDINPKFNVWVDGPFTISWFNGTNFMSETFTPRPNGTSVIITSYVASTVSEFTLTETTHNCTTKELVNFTPQIPSGPLTATASMITPVNCSSNNASTGTVTCVSNDGWGNYTYIWYNTTSTQVGTTQTIFVPVSACGEVWSCIITDNEGCTITTSVTIT